MINSFYLFLIYNIKRKTKNEPKVKSKTILIFKKFKTKKEKSPQTDLYI